MSAPYFLNFPKILYGNTSIDNLLLRVNFFDNSRNNDSIFYPYVVKDNEKAEEIAFSYYGDSNYVWIIYLFNSIIDPYYDWYLSVPQFENFITKKYGSIPEAQSTILYYEKNTSSYYISTDGTRIVPAIQYDPIADGYNYTLSLGSDYHTISVDTYNLNPLPAIYTPVDAYTDESIKNENKRFIKLLNSSYTSTISNQIETLLND